MRLLVIGNSEEYFMSTIGKIADELEHQLNFLKCCNMLKVLGDRPVTYEALLETIEEMNKARDSRLGQLVEVTMCTSSDPETLGFYGIKVYCENDKLSMAAPGFRYKAIDLTKTDMLPLEPEDVQYLLEVAAAFMDLDCLHPRSAEPAMKKARSRLAASAVVTMTRKALSSRLGTSAAVRHAA